MFRKTLPLILVLLACSAQHGYAQSYGMTARPFVQAPSVVGMGDAAVAFSSAETAFFYNPAHIATVRAGRPIITFLGVKAHVSEGVRDWYNFYTNDLDPAIEKGVENMSGQERQDLYDRAFEIAQRREYANADLLLPSVAFRVGTVGIGGGVFSNAGTQMQITDAGGGVPFIHVNGQADLMGVAAVGVQAAGAAVGVSGKFTRRYLTLKSKPLDAFGAEEALYVFSANRIGFDVGALYTLGMLPVPGKLTVGAALFDVVGSTFDYEVEHTINDGSASQQTEDEERAMANAQRQVTPSYRLGVAYQVPSLFGLFGETGVALDYLGYDKPMIADQPFLAHLHLGAQVRLVRMLAVRAGLSQGYPTAGAGLHLGPVRLDYSYYGQEEGRLPGQNASWHHQLRLAFGLF